MVTKSENSRRHFEGERHKAEREAAAREANRAKAVSALWTRTVCNRRRTSSLTSFCICLARFDSDNQVQTELVFATERQLMRFFAPAMPTHFFARVCVYMGM